jgi:adenylyltransferase/sulfurtransferase
LPSRYAVQKRFAPLGEQGQARLERATAVVVGVGALGGHSAQLLARAGVGRLRLVDPDRPSLDNLHRQVLYTEADVAAGSSKVQAAAGFLGAANRQITIEPLAEEFNEDNAPRLLAGAQVVVDGLDNPPARYARNRACLELGITWVHAGVVGSGGQLLVIRPGKGPCLQCWAPAEPTELRRSVATHGVIGPLPAVMGGLQAAEAIKLLAGAEEALLQGMLLVELWPPRFRVLTRDQTGSGPCPACGGVY